MPVVVTYVLENATSSDHNRIQSMFEQFGWENLGGSAYRYPRLGATHPTEDWFNHVVPALMLFRVFAIKRAGGKKIKIKIDTQSSTGFDDSGDFGSPPKQAGHILYQPSMRTLGRKELVKWVDGIVWPYD